MYTIVHINNDEGNRRAIGAFTDAGAATAFLIAANEILHQKYPTCTVDVDDTLLDVDGDGAVMLSVFVRNGDETYAEYHVVHVEHNDFVHL